MREYVQTQTGELITERQFNKLLDGATIITQKTADEALTLWGEKIGIGPVARVTPTDQPADHRATGHAEQNEAGEWVKLWEPITHDLNQIRAQAMNQINAHFQRLAEQQAGAYPEFEMQLWRRQEEEAREYQQWQTSGADPAQEPACTSLHRIAAERGIDFNVLARRVIANVDAWYPLADKLAGQRQAAADALYAANDKAGIDAVVAGLPVI